MPPRPRNLTSATGQTGDGDIVLTVTVDNSDVRRKVAETKRHLQSLKDLERTGVGPIQPLATGPVGGSQPFTRAVTPAQQAGLAIQQGASMARAMSPTTPTVVPRDAPPFWSQMVRTPSRGTRIRQAASTESVPVGQGQALPFFSSTGRVYQHVPARVPGQRGRNRQQFRRPTGRETELYEEGISTSRTAERQRVLDEIALRNPNIGREDSWAIEFRQTERERSSSENIRRSEFDRMMRSKPFRQDNYPVIVNEQASSRYRQQVQRRREAENRRERNQSARDYHQREAERTEHLRRLEEDPDYRYPHTQQYVDDQRRKTVESIGQTPESQYGYMSQYKKKLEGLDYKHQREAFLADPKNPDPWHYFQTKDLETWAKQNGLPWPPGEPTQREIDLQNEKREKAERQAKLGRTGQQERWKAKQEQARTAPPTDPIGDAKYEKQVWAWEAEQKRINEGLSDAYQEEQWDAMGYKRKRLRPGQLFDVPRIGSKKWKEYLTSHGITDIEEEFRIYKEDFSRNRNAYLSAFFPRTRKQRDEFHGRTHIPEVHTLPPRQPEPVEEVSLEQLKEQNAPELERQLRAKDEAEKHGMIWSAGDARKTEEVLRKQYEASDQLEESSTNLNEVARVQREQSRTGTTRAATDPRRKPPETPIVLAEPDGKPHVEEVRADQVENIQTGRVKAPTGETERLANSIDNLTNTVQVEQPGRAPSGGAAPPPMLKASEQQIDSLQGFLEASGDSVESVLDHVDEKQKELEAKSSEIEQKLTQTERKPTETQKRGRRTRTADHKEQPPAKSIGDALDQQIGAVPVETPEATKNFLAQMPEASIVAPPPPPPTPPTSEGPATPEPEPERDPDTGFIKPTREELALRRMAKLQEEMSRRTSFNKQLGMLSEKLDAIREIDRDLAEGRITESEARTRERVQKIEPFKRVMETTWLNEGGTTQEFEKFWDAQINRYATTADPEDFRLGVPPRLKALYQQEQTLKARYKDLYRYQQQVQAGVISRETAQVQIKALGIPEKKSAFKEEWRRLLATGEVPLVGPQEALGHIALEAQESLHKKTGRTAAPRSLEVLNRRWKAIVARVHEYDKMFVDDKIDTRARQALVRDLQIPEFKQDYERALVSAGFPDADRKRVGEILGAFRRTQMDEIRARETKQQERAEAQSQKQLEQQEKGLRATQRPKNRLGAFQWDFEQAELQHRQFSSLFEQWQDDLLVQGRDPTLDPEFLQWREMENQLIGDKQVALANLTEEQVLARKEDDLAQRERRRRFSFDRQAASYLTRNVSGLAILTAGLSVVGMGASMAILGLVEQIMKYVEETKKANAMTKDFRISLINTDMSAREYRETYQTLGQLSKETRMGLAGFDAYDQRQFGRLSPDTMTWIDDYAKTVSEALPNVDQELAAQALSAFYTGRGDIVGLGKKMGLMDHTLSEDFAHVTPDVAGRAYYLPELRKKVDAAFRVDDPDRTKRLFGYRTSDFGITEPDWFRLPDGMSQSEWNTRLMLNQTIPHEFDPNVERLAQLTSSNLTRTISGTENIEQWRRALLAEGQDYIEYAERLEQIEGLSPEYAAIVQQRVDRIKAFEAGLQELAKDPSVLPAQAVEDYGLRISRDQKLGNALRDITVEEMTISRMSVGQLTAQREKIREAQRSAERDGTLRPGFAVPVEQVAGEPTNATRAVTHPSASEAGHIFPLENRRRNPNQSLREFNIPEYAEGGRVPRTQLAMVGEEGPELLVLPGGSEVIPNDQLGSAKDGPKYGWRNALGELAEGFGWGSSMGLDPILWGLEQADKYVFRHIEQPLAEMFHPDEYKDLEFKGFGRGWESRYDRRLRERYREFEQQQGEKPGYMDRLDIRQKETPLWSQLLGGLTPDLLTMNWLGVAQTGTKALRKTSKMDELPLLTDAPEVGHLMDEGPLDEEAMAFWRGIETGGEDYRVMYKGGYSEDDVWKIVEHIQKNFPEKYKANWPFGPGRATMVPLDPKMLLRCEGKERAFCVPTALAKALNMPMEEVLKLTGNTGMPLEILDAMLGGTKSVDIPYNTESYLTLEELGTFGPPGDMLATNLMENMNTGSLVAHAYHLSRYEKDLTPIWDPKATTAYRPRGTAWFYDTFNTSPYGTAWESIRKPKSVSTEQKMYEDSLVTSFTMLSGQRVDSVAEMFRIVQRNKNEYALNLAKNLEGKYTIPTMEIPGIETAELPDAVEYMLMYYNTGRAPGFGYRVQRIPNFYRRHEPGYRYLQEHGLDVNYGNRSHLRETLDLLEEAQMMPDSKDYLAFLLAEKGPSFQAQVQELHDLGWRLYPNTSYDKAYVHGWDASTDPYDVLRSSSDWKIEYLRSRPERLPFPESLPIGAPDSEVDDAIRNFHDAISIGTSRTLPLEPIPDEYMQYLANAPNRATMSPYNVTPEDLKLRDELNPWCGPTALHKALHMPLDTCLRLFGNEPTDVSEISQMLSREPISMNRLTRQNAKIHMTLDRFASFAPPGEYVVALTFGGSLNDTPVQSHLIHLRKNQEGVLVKEDPILGYQTYSSSTEYYDTFEPGSTDFWDAQHPLLLPGVSYKSSVVDTVWPLGNEQLTEAADLYEQVSAGMSKHALELSTKPPSAKVPLVSARAPQGINIADLDYKTKYMLQYYLRGEAPYLHYSSLPVTPTVVNEPGYKFLLDQGLDPLLVNHPDLRARSLELNQQWPDADEVSSWSSEQRAAVQEMYDLGWRSYSKYSRPLLDADDIRKSDVYRVVSHDTGFMPEVEKQRLRRAKYGQELPKYGGAWDVRDFLNRGREAIQEGDFTSLQKYVDYFKEIGWINPYCEGGKTCGRELALVGEEGPELVVLPRGAEVVSNKRSKQLVKGYARGGVIGGGTPQAGDSLTGILKLNTASLAQDWKQAERISDRGAESVHTKMAQYQILNKENWDEVWSEILRTSSRAWQEETRLASAGLSWLQSMEAGELEVAGDVVFNLNFEGNPVDTSESWGQGLWDVLEGRFGSVDQTPLEATGPEVLFDIPLIGWLLKGGKWLGSLWIGAWSWIHQNLLGDPPEPPDEEGKGPGISFNVDVINWTVKGLKWLGSLWIKAWSWIKQNLFGDPPEAPDEESEGPEVHFKIDVIGWIIKGLKWLGNLWSESWSWIKQNLFGEPPDPPDEESDGPDVHFKIDVIGWIIGGLKKAGSLMSEAWSWVEQNLFGADPEPENVTAKGPEIEFKIPRVFLTFGTLPGAIGAGLKWVSVLAKKVFNKDKLEHTPEDQEVEAGSINFKVAIKINGFDIGEWLGKLKDKLKETFDGAKDLGKGLLGLSKEPDESDLRLLPDGTNKEPTWVPTSYPSDGMSFEGSDLALWLDADREHRGTALFSPKGPSQFSPDEEKVNKEILRLIEERNQKAERLQKELNTHTKNGQVTYHNDILTATEEALQAQNKLTQAYEENRWRLTDKGWLRQLALLRDQGLRMEALQLQAVMNGQEVRVESANRQLTLQQVYQQQRMELARLHAEQIRAIQQKADEARLAAQVEAARREAEAEYASQQARLEAQREAERHLAEIQRNAEQERIKKHVDGLNDQLEALESHGEASRAQQLRAEVAYLATLVETGDLQVQTAEGGFLKLQNTLERTLKALEVDVDVNVEVTRVTHTTVVRKSGGGGGGGGGGGVPLPPAPVVRKVSLYDADPDHNTVRTKLNTNPYSGTGRGTSTGLFGEDLSDAARGLNVPFTDHILVGERGPEIVRIPGGSRIRPTHNLAAQIMSAGFSSSYGNTATNGTAQSNRSSNSSPKEFTIKLDIDGRTFKEVVVEIVNDEVRQKSSGYDF